MSIIKTIAIILPILACDKIAEKFGSDRQVAASNTAVQAAYQSRPIKDQKVNLEQRNVTTPNNFECAEGSPALVKYDKDSQGFFYCNQGTWTQVAFPVPEKILEKKQEITVDGADKVRQKNFIIKPQTDSFLCTQSESFRNSYICSKKNRVLSKQAEKKNETTLTEGP